MFAPSILAVLLLALPPAAAPATGDDIAVLETELGTIRVQLLPAKAPRHVENFRKLVRDGFYDGTTFHRVIPGYIVQGGSPASKDPDPKNDSFGGPGYAVKSEFNDLLHERGAFAMARDVNDPDSAGSQFFVVLARAPELDQIKFTIFGKVLEGLELLDKIAAAPRDVENYDRPLSPVAIKRLVIGGAGAVPIALAPAPGTMSAAAAGGTAGAGRVRITAPGLVNLREGPGTDRPVVQRLSSGTELAVKSRSGEWIAVELQGGKTAWIRQDMVAPAGAAR